jgi:transposase
VYWRFEPADQISACPAAPRAAVTVVPHPHHKEHTVEEAGDEPLFCERAAGIDIGKQLVPVTIRVPSDTRKGGRQQETREFGTTRRQLLEMADWLACWGVTRAGMESTSDYWKPVFFLLEKAGFDCLLYQSSKVKALPGRPKTDRLDAAWLARITGQGTLAGSFVPPEDIRRLRTHTRYRRRLVQARTAERQRCEKLLEDAHLKLSSVISDIHGVSGRAMLEAVIAGERNPKVLAGLARGRLDSPRRAGPERPLACADSPSPHPFRGSALLPRPRVGAMPITTRPFQTKEAVTYSSSA